MRFDRFDICAAHAALECDWNKGGILIERPSNARRNESTGVQLHRLQFRAAPAHAGGFDQLENDNARCIYVTAARRMGLALSADDESHAAILAWEQSMGTGLVWDSYSYTVADHYLSALINGDDSGMTDAEIAELKQFEESAHAHAAREGFTQWHWSTESDEEPSFQECDVSGMRANCVELTLVCARPMGDQ
jgi:hypothetical protein